MSKWCKVSKRGLLCKEREKHRGVGSAPATVSGYNSPTIRRTR